MSVILEGLVLSFWLLLVCVVGIAKDGPVGLVTRSHVCPCESVKVYLFMCARSPSFMPL